MLGDKWLVLQHTQQVENTSIWTHHYHDCIIIKDLMLMSRPFTPNTVVIKLKPPVGVNRLAMIADALFALNLYSFAQLFAHLSQVQ